MYLNLDLLTGQNLSFSSHKEVVVMSEARRSHNHHHFFPAETSWSHCFFADRDQSFTVEGPECLSYLFIISFSISTSHIINHTVIK